MLILPDAIQTKSEAVSERLSRVEQKDAEEFGESESFRIYQTEEHKPYHEKGSHLARTLAHDQRPNGHRRHFRNLTEIKK